MSYATVETFTKNAAYRIQVKVAIQEVAQYIVEGNGGVPMSVNHHNYAADAKRTPDKYIDWFIYYVAQDTTVQADGVNPTDAHIKAVVDAKRVQVWS